MYNIDSLGVMIDLSRNGVMTLDSLKKFLKTIKKFGYNTVFLYMEDTFEIKDEPYFGYMRSRYSCDEMREIDLFCSSIGIEAIPCIQTLAHLRTFFKWKQVPVDCDDILLVDEKRTYELIDNMFKSLSGCFKSKRIHIGMDEAHLLGKGNYCIKHGYSSSDEIIKKHLENVCQIAKAYNYELLIWSDMLFRSWNKGEYYLKEEKTVPRQVIECLPKNVLPVYWDYYSGSKQEYDAMIKMHKQLSDNSWFAGGAWSWAGFAPLNSFSIRIMKEAIEACRANDIKNIFMTMWGDDGMECSHFSQLPALLCIAEYANGNFDENKIKAKFKKIVGVEFDLFMKLDLPNLLEVNSPRYWENPSKYMLYSDLFCGFLDYTVTEGTGELFGRYSRELLNASKSTRAYGYIFKTLSSLCGALEIKYELGVKTRNLYKGKDKNGLKTLASCEYTELEKRIAHLHKCFERQWYIDNKPSGFEVHDARLGGLLQRVRSCKKRLLDYANGRIEKIDELETDILPLGFADSPNGQPISYNSYANTFSSNVF